MCHEGGPPRVVTDDPLQHVRRPVPEVAQDQRLRLRRIRPPRVQNLSPLAQLDRSIDDHCQGVADAVRQLRVRLLQTANFGSLRVLRELFEWPSNPLHLEGMGVCPPPCLFLVRAFEFRASSF